MKIKVIVLILIFLSVNGTAFNINSWCWDVNSRCSKFVGLNRITISNVIEGKDLKVSIGIDQWVHKNFSREYNNLTIIFEALEKRKRLSVEDLTLEACFGSFGGRRYGERNIECDRVISIFNRSGPDNIYDLILRIPEFDEEYKNIVVRITYTIPNFIIEQGMYDVIWLSYPNMNYNISSEVVLPKNTSIPYRFPEDAEITIDRKGRWVFSLEGTKDRFIWYTDAEEIEKHEKDIRDEGVFIGAVIGLFVAVIVSIIMYLLSRRESKKQMDNIVSNFKDQINDLKNYLDVKPKLEVKNNNEKRRNRT